MSHVEILETGDLELAVPAPAGSRSKHLVVFTARGEDGWIRYAPPRVAYPIDSEDELHAIIDALLRDDAFLVAVTSGDDWIEATLPDPRGARVGRGPMWRTASLGRGNTIAS